MAELQEGQGDDQGDEDVNEETAEDVVGRTPDSQVVAHDNSLQLIEEGRCVYEYRIQTKKPRE